MNVLRPDLNSYQSARQIEKMSNLQDAHIFKNHIAQRIIRVEVLVVGIGLREISKLVVIQTMP